MRLKDKIAMISGAGSGIGQAIVVRFVREGAKVSFCDIDEERLNKTKGLIEKVKGDYLSMMCDVADEKQVDEWVKATTKRFGRIDIMVTNAGIYLTDKVAPVQKYSVEAFDKIMDVNAKSVFLCIRRVVPEMLKVGKGKIINMGSVDGMRPLPMGVAYNTSKAASHMIAMSAAVDLAPKNICVNTIAPGLLDTNMLRPILPVMEKDYLQRTPARRLVTVEDVASTAVFLASDESDIINGQVIVPDGGYMTSPFGGRKTK